MIIGINTTCDISNLSQIEITYNNNISKYHLWYLCQISLQIMLLPILIASLVLGSLRHNTVQYSLILQSVIMLPPSCIGD